MQNKEDKLLHKLSDFCIWVIYSLTFGINLSNFRNNLERFHCRVILHSSKIISRSPTTPQLKCLCKTIFICPIRCIMCNH